MRTIIHCNHYRAMSEHETCEAGVEYEKFKGLPFAQRPCFCRHGKPAPGGCEKAAFPDAAELARQDAEDEARFAAVDKARQAILANIGHPWRKGVAGVSGHLPCPVCAKGTLSYSRSGYNGHIMANCSTDNCVSWME